MRGASGKKKDKGKRSSKTIAETAATTVTRHASTTPQMTCFCGAKVCIKRLQERSDDQIIQPDNKFKFGPKVRIQFGPLCLRGDYTITIPTPMTT